MGVVVLIFIEHRIRRKKKYPSNNNTDKPEQGRGTLQKKDHTGFSSYKRIIR